MESQRLRVVILTAWYPTKSNSTFGIFIKEQAAALALHHDVTLVAILRRPSVSRVEQQQGQLHTIVIHDPLLALTNKGKLRRWSQIAEREVKAMEATRPIDIIHLHDMHPVSAAPSLRQCTEAPVVATIHNTDFSLGLVKHSYVGPLRAGLQSCDQVIAVGEPLRQVLVREYGASSTTVVPNMIDTERFILGTPPANTKELIVVASLRPVKRLRSVIKAMALLKDDSVRLHIAGDGPLLQELTELVVQLGLEHKVRLHGAVSRADLPKLMQQCMINVCVSEVETFGIAAMEGLSAGLPLVYSRSGLEMLVPDYAGVCTDGSSQAIADAVMHIINNYDSYDQERLRQYVVERYGHSHVTNALTRLYLQLTQA